MPTEKPTGLVTEKEGLEKINRAYWPLGGPAQTKEESEKLHHSLGRARMFPPGMVLDFLESQSLKRIKACFQSHQNSSPQMANSTET